MGGSDGVYLNQNNEEVIFNPSTKNMGDNSLLIDKHFFLAYLKKQDYEVFWTITSEKFTHIGKTDISGIYYYENNKLNGSLKIHDFEKFPRR